MKYKPKVAQFNFYGRSPCGERGLKSAWRGWRKCWTESLPVRGAWIEIRRTSRKRCGKPSLPVRGAWIEISAQSIYLSAPVRRSPCGERGLKCGA